MSHFVISMKKSEYIVYSRYCFRRKILTADSVAYLYYYYLFIIPLLVYDEEFNFKSHYESLPLIPMSVAITSDFYFNRSQLAIATRKSSKRPQSKSPFYRQTTAFCMMKWCSVRKRSLTKCPAICPYATLWIPVQKPTIWRCDSLARTPNNAMSSHWTSKYCKGQKRILWIAIWLITDALHSIY